MRAVISEYNEEALCLWCNRNAEGVTVEFDGGFLQKGPLCWRCLQQATRVHNLQAHEVGQAVGVPAKGRSDAIS